MGKYAIGEELLIIRNGEYNLKQPEKIISETVGTGTVVAYNEDSNTYLVRNTFGKEYTGHDFEDKKCENGEVFFISRTDLFSYVEGRVNELSGEIDNNINLEHAVMRFFNIAYGNVKKINGKVCVYNSVDGKWHSRDEFGKQLSKGEIVYAFDCKNEESGNIHDLIKSIIKNDSGFMELTIESVINHESEHPLYIARQKSDGTLYQGTYALYNPEGYVFLRLLDYLFVMRDIRQGLSKIIKEENKTLNYVRELLGQTEDAIIGDEGYIPRELVIEQRAR